MPNPPGMSPKDGMQVLRAVMDDTNNRLRVDAVVSPDGHDLEIHYTDDSIAIGDPASDNILAINPDGSINVAGTSTITGSVSVTGGTISTDINGLANFQTTVYTVNTSAVHLTVTPLPNRSSMGFKAVCNPGAIIFIGNSSGVTTTTGYPLFNGDTLQLDLTGSQAVYAIASVIGQTLYVLEIG